MSGAGETRHLHSAVLRNDWLQRELSKRVDEFTEQKQVSIFIGTWNVNAKKVGEDLQAWLIPNQEQQQAQTRSSYNEALSETSDPISVNSITSTSGAAEDSSSTNWTGSSSSSSTSDSVSSHFDLSGLSDIYCIGFQEIVDLNATSLLVEHTAFKPWQEKIQRTLRHSYILVATQQLVGLATCVYIKRELFPYVSEIQTERVGVGIMGVGGNKGAVAIRFLLYDTSYCFVNSHLAAHQHNSAGRNSDFHSIVSKCHFTDKTTLNQYDIYSHDYLFWLGDLNYRINLTDLNGVIQRIENQEWKYLLSCDQLIQEKKNSHAFSSFIEPEINFPPTYKYQVGTHIYEKREEKKKRIPAWCDRIQYYNPNNNNNNNNNNNTITHNNNYSIECIEYNRAELITSDHKPVYGIFTTICKLLIFERKERIKLELIHSLDTQENQAMPKITLIPHQLIFPLIQFNRPSIQFITVTNIGTSIAAFSFKPNNPNNINTNNNNLNNPNNICKKWLQINPIAGLLTVGESITIKLTILINSSTSENIMIGKDSLEDILIFGLENGRDYFLTLVGEYQRTSLGCSIEWLCNQLEPIRRDNKNNNNNKSNEQKHSGSTRSNNNNNNKTNNNDKSRALSVPKELFALVDYISKYGLKEPDLFTTTGKQKQVEFIIDCIDTGQAIPPRPPIQTGMPGQDSDLASPSVCMDDESSTNPTGADDNNNDNNTSGNSNTNLSHVSIHSVVEALLYWLDSLSSPVISPSLLLPFDDFASPQLFANFLLAALSPSHYNTFIYLMTFLREILRIQAQEQNEREKQREREGKEAARRNPQDPTDNEGDGEEAEAGEERGVEGVSLVKVIEVFGNVLFGREEEIAVVTGPENGNGNENAGEPERQRQRIWIVLRHFLTTKDFPPPHNS